MISCWIEPQPLVGSQCKNYGEKHDQQNAQDKTGDAGKNCGKQY